MKFKCLSTKFKRQKIYIRVLLFLVIVLINITVLQFIFYKNLKTTAEIEKNEINLRLLKLETDNKNLLEGLGLKGESIYEKTKYKDIIKQALKNSKDFYYLENLSDFEKQIYYDEHGKDYKLRYDWMINPVINGYMPLKGCEFGRPRMDNKGNFWGHTGTDQKTLNNTNLQAPCDSIVSSIGYDINGGYYIILKTIKQELNLKTGKIEDVTYENYLGHIAEEIKIIKDQDVKKGDIIAIMSDTGLDQSGVHCHWSIKRNGILMNPFVNTTWNNTIVEKIYPNSSYYNF